MSKIILHIDLNAFFVRCEEIKDPSLEGKPVIIGHNGRGGIVSTCSYAARKYGVHSGMPTYQALLKCKDAILIPGDYRYYEQKSNEFFAFIKKYTTIVEPASIDECYADFTNVFKDKSEPIVFLRNLQKELYKETKLFCSIGVAPTRFLAKMASDMKKPNGLTIIRKKDSRNLLSPLPIDSFFGIGKKTAPRLKELGINTIGDLINRIDADDNATKEVFGKFYYVIKDWIDGKGGDEINTEPWDPKSVGHSTTLFSDALSVEELEKPLTLRSLGGITALAGVTFKNFDLQASYTFGLGESDEVKWYSTDGNDNYLSSVAYKRSTFAVKLGYQFILTERLGITPQLGYEIERLSGSVKDGTNLYGDGASANCLSLGAKLLWAPIQRLYVFANPAFSIGMSKDDNFKKITDNSDIKAGGFMMSIGAIFNF